MSNKQPIERLTIRGFKSIRALEAFPLRELNVLIGANGAGKSNLVSYFHMLREMIDGRLQHWTAKRGSAERIVSYGIKETTHISSVIQFRPSSEDAQTRQPQPRNNDRYLFDLETDIEGRFKFSDESIFFNHPDQQDYHIVLGHEHQESLLKDTYRRFRQPTDDAAINNAISRCYNSMMRCQVYHVHDTSETAGMRRIGSVHDDSYLRPDASNLGAFLYRLAHEAPATYRQIRKTVRLAIPFFDDFILKPRTLPTGEQQLYLQWRQKNSDYTFWPSHLSDGAIRFICLVTALLQPDPPATIIIDEPELGLHPYALTVLGALIRSASTRMQVIVSTQSVSLVNQFDINDLIIVERRDGASTFERRSEEDLKVWLEDYAAGELWEKNLLGGTPRS